MGSSSLFEKRTLQQTANAKARWRGVKQWRAGRGMALFPGFGHQEVGARLSRALDGHVSNRPGTSLHEFPSPSHCRVQEASRSVQN